jgi:hypothetical protein
MVGSGGIATSITTAGPFRGPSMMRRGKKVAPEHKDGQRQVIGVWSSPRRHSSERSTTRVWRGSFHGIQG